MRIDAAHGWRGVFGGLVLAAGALAGPARAQEASSGLALDWVFGPAVGDLGGIAEIRVPEGYQFVAGADARRLLEAMENPTDGSEMGLLARSDDDWFLVFEFAKVGYVKDDEKNALDADDILETLRAGNDRANRERRKHGWGELTLVGWALPPRYNAETHNLEWATRSRADGRIVVNHNTRLLGRRGVMEVTLVCDPEDLASVLPERERLLEGYSFGSGHSYGEFRAGDRIAEVGLTALVAGGAAAVAVKSGLLGKLWKFLAVGVVAVAGFVRRLFKGRSVEGSPA